MKTNISAFDGWMRILFFIVTLFFAIFTGSTTLWIIALVPGLVFFLTAVLTWCPLYDMFGIATAEQN